MPRVKEVLRQRRKRRVRSKVFGTSEKPRLSVFRSLSAISAQVIDDEKGVTIASVYLKNGNIEGAKKLGKELGGKWKGKCVFDRNGYAYHGRVKAFADSARQEGLEF